MKWSADGLCSFDESTHTYRIRERVLPGVTTIISRYKHKFDSDAQAERYAIKHDLKKEDVLADWKRKGDESIKTGNGVHLLLESLASEPCVPDPACGKQRTAARLHEEMFSSGRLKAIGSEFVVHNGYIASQIDRLAQSPEGCLYILDWKTNKAISKDSWGRFMLPPFQDLPDATFYHYSLQLSFYQELLNRPTAGAYIVHIWDDGYQFIKPLSITIPQHILHDTDPTTH